MKKFFKEFGEFIKRGNVLDMAVGVIIGGAFSAIVTALTNHILMPVINWFLLLITGGNGLDSIYTYLRWVGQTDEAGNPVLTEAGAQAVDLAKSIYIDWGAFITAIINFILIALVLFLIIRTINRVSNQMDVNAKMKEKLESKMRKGDRFTPAEERWVARMKKNHPEMVPNIDPPAEPEPAPAPAPTETELLTAILEELRSQKAE